MKKTLILIFLFFIITGCNFRNNTKKNTNEGSAIHTEELSDVIVMGDNIEEITFSDEQLKSYISSYQDPFVLHVRIALNGYLDNTDSGMDMPDITIAKRIEDGIIYGLDSFDQLYYKSKFTVLAVNENFSGGYNIDIIFQDKPDKIFTAWVYQLAGGEYDLRAFWDKGLTSEEIEEIIRMYKKYIFDKNYSL